MKRRWEVHVPEPASTATATIAASAVAVPALTMLGVPLGLRADVLVAGFSGALAAIALLNSVPAGGDSWQAMVRTALRRMSVALTSSLTAGYITPLALTLAAMPQELLLGGAFVVGGGAQQVLATVIRRLQRGTGGEGTP